MVQSYLREEFQTYCGINRNVSSNTKADEGCENEDSIVSGRRRKAQTENGRNQDCKVESVLASCQWLLVQDPQSISEQGE